MPNGISSAVTPIFHQFGRTQQKKGEKDTFWPVLGISAGIEASQVAKDTGLYKSSISTKATMSAELIGNLSQREKLNCKKPRICRLKMSIPITKNGDNYSPLKKNANIHQACYLIHFLKTWTIKAVLDFWKRIISGSVAQDQLKGKIHCEIQINTQNSLNMLWSCQTSSTRNNRLDQYPILCVQSTNTILCAKGKNLSGLTRPRKIPGPGPGFVPTLQRIFNIAVRLPLPSSAMTYLRLSNTDIIEVIQYRFEELSVSCSYEHCSAEFCVVCICQFSGTVLCTRSIIENSFAGSLMTTWCPCIWPC